LSPEFQKQVIHLWSGWTKGWRLLGRRQGTKTELNDRLDYVRAFLMARARVWSRFMRDEEGKIQEDQILGNLNPIKQTLKSADNQGTADTGGSSSR
jgi:hypothetical protein